MRRFLAGVILLAGLCIESSAQVQIWTKKHLIEDFRDKTTKIVLPGNVFLDNAITSAASQVWNITAYELCTMQEYNALKDNPSYYFLLISTLKYPKETGAGTRVIELFRGGHDAKGKTQTILSLPIGPAGNIDPSIDTYLPAMLQLMQNYTEKALESDTVAYGEVGKIASISNIKEGDMVFTQAESATAAFSEGLQGTHALCIITSESPTPGVSYVYKFVIGCGDGSLSYYSKRKYRSEADLQMNPSEIKQLTDKGAVLR